MKKRLFMLLGAMVLGATALSSFAAEIILKDDRPKITFSPLQSLRVDRSQVIAGSRDVVIATVGLRSAAPAGGATVQFSVTPSVPEAGFLAIPEFESVTIPQGRNSATVRIRTVVNPFYPVPTVCTLTARYSGDSREVQFTVVDQLRITGLVVLPGAGFNSFGATGTVNLNAVPAVGTAVSITTNRPDVVSFGSIGSFQSSLTLNPNSAWATFSVSASAAQTTTASIIATLFKQQVATSITVRTL